MPTTSAVLLSSSRLSIRANARAAKADDDVVTAREMAGDPDLGSAHEPAQDRRCGDPEREHEAEVVRQAHRLGVFKPQQITARGQRKKDPVEELEVCDKP